MWLTKAKEEIQKSSKESSVYIGCDSRRIAAKNKAIYSVVVILHRDSSKGCAIFRERRVIPDYGNLRQRLLTEVQIAVEVALEIAEVVDDRKLEIHLDINPNPKYKSSVVVKEATGWVKSALGLDAKIKPDGFAATAAADHWVRK